MSIEKQIIDKYVIIVKNLFEKIEQSISLKEFDYPFSSIYVSINSMHRVYEYVLTRTKSIEKAYYYAQKTYYYYLEYMEQISQSALFLNLNHKDAILFVYKKTIFWFEEGDNHVAGSPDAMSNIMTMNDAVLEIDNDTLKPLFLKMSRTINVLADWGEQIEFHQRVSVVNTYLERFLYSTRDIDLALSFIELMQQKCAAHYTPLIINEILNYIEGPLYIVVAPDATTDLIIKKCYIDETNFINKMKEISAHDYVKWLFTQ
jgi:hypothetical protein